jgi:hypothetical protein
MDWSDIALDILEAAADAERVAVRLRQIATLCQMEQYERDRDAGRVALRRLEEVGRDGRDCQNEVPPCE